MLVSLESAGTAELLLAEAADKLAGGQLQLPALVVALRLEALAGLVHQRLVVFLTSARGTFIVIESPFLHLALRLLKNRS